MAAETKAAVPANIAEFNSIAGHVFAQLYESFPTPIGRLNDFLIAKAMMGVSSGAILALG